VWVCICVCVCLLQLAEQLYRTLCRKYKESAKVWLRYILFKIRTAGIEAARAIFQRSLQSLPKRKCTSGISIVLFLLFCMSVTVVVVMVMVVARSRRGGDQ
jgi:hypothetical protein